MAPQKRTQQQIRDDLGTAIQVGDVITIQDAKIIWPNFSGAKDQYNSEGDRNFNLHLTKAQADELAADGWNVKCKNPRPEDEDSEERCVLKVTVKFENKPPTITMIGNRSRNRTKIHAGIAGLLDSADIVETDLSIVPYFWEVRDGMGVSAYLRNMYCVVREDELDEKWAEPSEDE